MEETRYFNLTFLSPSFSSIVQWKSWEKWMQQKLKLLKNIKEDKGKDRQWQNKIESIPFIIFSFHKKIYVVSPTIISSMFFPQKNLWNLALEFIYNYMESTLGISAELIFEEGGNREHKSTHLASLASLTGCLSLLRWLRDVS